MMTGRRVRKTAIEAVTLVLLSLLVLMLGFFLSGEKKNDRLQYMYDGRFSDILSADYYQEISSPLINENRNITHVYEAKKMDGTTAGYILDVNVTNEEGEVLNFLTGVTFDGAQLTGIRYVGGGDVSPDHMQIAADQTVGHQIPVAQARDTSAIADPETGVTPLSGLHDGTYYAQSLTCDSNGYIDYVELQVENGIITRVQWDAFNVDRTTKDRREASLSGAYYSSGESWATQSYNLCHALMQLQDPSLLAMKSDGTTEIIEGVTTNIRRFVELSEECIENSRHGFDKEQYLEGLASVVEELFGTPVEELGILNEQSYIVYSFEDYPDLFGGLDLRGYLGSREGGGDAGPDTDPEEVQQDQDENRTSLIGGEDGVVPAGNDDVITDNVDGLPLSEIRTRISGIPGDQQLTDSVISAINYSYIFLKNYLNWMA